MYFVVTVKYIGNSNMNCSIINDSEAKKVGSSNAWWRLNIYGGMECFTFSFWPRYLGLIFIRHSIGNRILNLLGRNMIGNQSLRLPLTSIPSSCHLARLYTYLPSLGLCLLDTRHPLPEVLLMLKCCPIGLNLQWYSELPCTLTWPSSVFGCICHLPLLGSLVPGDLDSKIM